MNPSLPNVLTDLADERRKLRSLVIGLAEETWARRSSADRTIRDQIAHLAYYDDVAVVAIADPDEFAEIEQSARAEPGAFERAHLRSVPASGQATLIAWNRAVAAFDLVVGCVPATGRIPWFGSEVSVLDMVTDRLADTRACAQDVADALEKPLIRRGHGEDHVLVEGDAAAFAWLGMGQACAGAPRTESARPAREGGRR